MFEHAATTRATVDGRPDATARVFLGRRASHSLLAGVHVAMPYMIVRGFIEMHVLARIKSPSLLYQVESQTLRSTCLMCTALLSPA